MLYFQRLVNKIAILFIVSLFVSGSAYSGAGHGDGAGHGQKMLSSAKQMITHGTAGHMSMMVTHAKKMIEHAKMIISSIHGNDTHGKTAKMHINEAIKAAQVAIEHGDKGHQSMAMESAQSAIEHAKEGASHLKS